MENPISIEALEEMIAEQEDHYAHLFAAGGSPTDLHAIWMDIRSLRHSLQMLSSEKSILMAGVVNKAPGQETPAWQTLKFSHSFPASSAKN
jgi:hypothetical protein